MHMNTNYKICVIGLGYVGLPLARLFSTKYQTVGFDMNQSRVDALMVDTMQHLRLRTTYFRRPSRMVSSVQQILRTSKIVMFILLLFQPLLMITIDLISVHYGVLARL